ncbi:MAG TPA: redoxin domain-containing protein, partial [Gemmatimonadales bacterium]|nr:redoxin domain-containing protein [Gemmatimonadales bacterium]
MTRLPLLAAAYSLFLVGAGPLDQPTPRPAPDWANTSWLNADRPLALKDLRGRVVLLNFWVFTCYNCTNTVPSLVDFDRRYRNRGLTILGIHTPEFPPYAGEHDKGNVERALRQ